MARRGHDVTVVSKGERPRWFPLRTRFRQVPALEPRHLPGADVTVATFWTTIKAAAAVTSGTGAHYCQGFEGGFRHNLDDHAAITEAYQLPIPCLALSPHLAVLVRERFGRPARVVPPALAPYWRPRWRRRPRRTPRVVVPNPFEIEWKGVSTGARGRAPAEVARVLVPPGPPVAVAARRRGAGPPGAGRVPPPPRAARCCSAPPWRGPHAGPFVGGRRVRAAGAGGDGERVAGGGIGHLGLSGVCRHGRGAGASRPAGGVRRGGDGRFWTIRRVGGRCGVGASTPRAGSRRSEWRRLRRRPCTGSPRVAGVWRREGETLMARDGVRPVLWLRARSRRSVVAEHLRHVAGSFEAAGWEVVTDDRLDPPSAAALAVMEDPWVEPLPEAGPGPRDGARRGPASVACPARVGPDGEPGMAGESPGDDAGVRAANGQRSAPRTVSLEQRPVVRFLRRGSGPGRDAARGRMAAEHGGNRHDGPPVPLLRPVERTRGVS